MSVGADGQDWAVLSCASTPALHQNVWCLAQELINLKAEYAFNHSVCRKSPVEVLKTSHEQGSSFNERVLAHGSDVSC